MRSGSLSDGGADNNNNNITSVVLLLPYVDIYIYIYMFLLDKAYRHTFLTRHKWIAESSCSIWPEYLSILESRVIAYASSKSKSGGGWRMSRFGRG
jgi:hypothetical protein